MPRSWINNSKRCGIKYEVKDTMGAYNSVQTSKM